MIFYHRRTFLSYIYRKSFTDPLIKSYDITPSMSRRANPYDNAMAENFFSILKAECIYRHKPASFCEANEMIDRYIYFYNHERIQLKTGEPPLTRRLST
ncbi:IS3 family transposase [Anaerotignum lactatifermentans]|uniref:IS3 family transposase n=1 Tax=Anaerotignum lactatifermentans TaxID=160404 RepID=UPI002E8DD0C3|nr:integrase core domain-containing protein [Anaerotignum lactatifermentans]